MVKIENELKLGFKDVLVRPKRSSLRSRRDVKLVRKYIFKHACFEWSGVPIIAANMDTVGTFEMAEAFSKQQCVVAIHKHYPIEEWQRFIDKHTPAALSFNNKSKSNTNANTNTNTNTSTDIDANTNKNTTNNRNDGDINIFNYICVSSGTSDHDFNRICTILALSPLLRLICLDVANGYSEFFVAYVKKVRAKFPKHAIIAGNVVTGEMTEQLILSGADVVKVGIGPGSVCTTRKKTGVGYPQLSAVLECADAAHGLGGLIISDGGCTMPGDFSKAFGAGADFVMAGGMFSGYDQSGGDLVTDTNGKRFKQFYGMSSAMAMSKHSSNKVTNYRASEGKCVLVPYRGDVDQCLNTILGGIRSTCTYVGAAQLKELTKRTTFIRVQHHHNIIFGDENNSKFDQKPNASASATTNVSSNQNNATMTTNNKKLLVFDPMSSMNNLYVSSNAVNTKNASSSSAVLLKQERKALLQFLTETAAAAADLSSDETVESKAGDDEEESANKNASQKTTTTTTTTTKRTAFFDSLSPGLKNEFFAWIQQTQQASDNNSNGNNAQ